MRQSDGPGLARRAGPPGLVGPDRIGRDRRRCIVGSVEAFNPSRSAGDIAWASSVKAAATRSAVEASMASSQ